MLEVDFDILAFSISHFTHLLSKLMCFCRLAFSLLFMYVQMV